MQYNMEQGLRAVRIEAESSEDSCMILAIQNIQVSLTFHRHIFMLTIGILIACVLLAQGCHVIQIARKNCKQTSYIFLCRVSFV